MSWNDLETIDPSGPATSVVKERPVLTIITHPDMSRVGSWLRFDSTAEVPISRSEGNFVRPGGNTGVPLQDPGVSRSPFMIKADRGNRVTLDPTGTRTLVEVKGKQLSESKTYSMEKVRRGIPIVLGKRILLYLHLAVSYKGSGPQLGIVGESDSVVYLRQEILRVADLETPVLLRGESGTGKELAAQAIHDQGKKGKPFVPVNMGAIPETLAASELFGARRGAYTGANRDHVGFFARAQGGTLFLDEIGETPESVQVLLLRALESGEIQQVGSPMSQKVTARLVAATDADLESKMEGNSFKTPLFHRLAGYEISLPPLRERREDWGRLFLHFAREELAGIGESDRLENIREPWLPTDLGLRLLMFQWPGNIRQLRNIVRQLVIGCRGETQLHMVPMVESQLGRVAFETNPTETNATKEARIVKRPGDITPEEVRNTLRECAYDIKAAADALNISRGTLYTLIEKTPGIRKASDLTASEIEAVLFDGDYVTAARQLEVSVRALKRRAGELGI